jgi:SAM-dependent methyltransferase
LPKLPARYDEGWTPPFEDRVRRVLRPDIVILDVGAGRQPTIPPEGRPPRCRYVGLDISAAELAAAPPGSYDETWVADTTKHLPQLDGRFDRIVSWQVLEHVKPIEDAFDNFWKYLRPSGRFIGQFSGTFSCFGLANKILPHTVTVMLLHRLGQRDPATVFPAYYHRCWDSALRRVLSSWSQVEIVPRYIGAQYLGALPPIQWLYLRYEGWALRTRRRNLATHYIIDAGR